MTAPVLETPIQFIKGIGPKRAELLARAGVENSGQLLAWYPRRYVDRTRLQKIRHLKSGDYATVAGRILGCNVVQGRKKRFVALVGDDSGSMQCVWFHAVSYMAKRFKPGDTVVFSGRVTQYRGPQMVHPEYDMMDDSGESDRLNTGAIIPMYSSTEALSRGGLDSRGFRRILHGLVLQLDESIPDVLPEEIRTSRALMDRRRALENVHFPDNWHRLKEAQRRLKFEELFFLQLYLAMQRKNRKINHKGIAFTRVGDQTRQLVENLPFELTEAQKRVLREIRKDMGSDLAMSRLLQGDVGSGKTIVALVAMLIAVENGYQAALMAPTEILAEQHYLTLHAQLEALGVRVALLKGSQKGSVKKEIQRQISEGEIDIAVGTHALVQKDVEFHKLGMTVIDEQHRFGVMQRATLMRKGAAPDVLVMTATPIPRTLALTLYGDLDVSILNELPAGRQPVTTVWRRAEKKAAIYSYIKSQVKEGRQAYIIYPLVEESEKMDLAAATEGFEQLSAGVFKNVRVALLHGRMKSDEKESVMKAFKAGETDILVSTTVVEVGVNVPNATVMLIEHAERFGLTQLHQLRGRVGRGAYASTCILLTYGYLNDDAMKRINTMVATRDGFRIAEADLEIRGPGELHGTRQSGALDLHIADLMTDGAILQEAREDAFQLIENDPQLGKEENQNLKQEFFRHYHHRFGLMDVG